MSALRARADQHDDHLLPVSIGQGQRLVFLPFSSIRPFKSHPFRLYTGERLDDMVESVKTNGILTPLLVRRIKGDPEFDYEMLAGHNRMNAGRMAGLDGALCVVKEQLSDTDALMYVIETNLMQRSFSELLPSEKAAVLALRYSEMFSQGKRNDIIRELREMESGGVYQSNATCGNDCHKSKSRDSVGEEYAMKGRMVAYYLRVHSLIPPLKLRTDNGEFSLVTASKLSYLSEETQGYVDQLLSQCRYNVNALKIDALRGADRNGPLTLNQTFQILMDVEARKAALPVVKIKPKTYQRFFAPGTAVSEMEETIEKALTLYFERQGGKESA